MKKKTKRSMPKILKFIIHLFIIATAIVTFSIINFYFIGIFEKEPRIEMSVSRIIIGSYDSDAVKFEYQNQKLESHIQAMKEKRKADKIKEKEEKKQAAKIEKEEKKKAEIVKVDDRILTDLLTPLKNGETKVQLYAETLESNLGPITYFNQSDYRWAKHKYGKESPMYSAGCGPTTMAMVINTISPSEFITPDKMADFAYSKGCYIDGGGSTHDIVRKCANEYNVNAKVINETANDIKQALDNNKLVVALVGRGEFTQGGHFILITSIDENNKLSIADSISIENTHKKWDTDFIIKQLKKSVSAGPLWAIG